MSQSPDPRLSSPSAPIPVARPVQPLELAYAPPAKSQSRAIWVIAAGLVTTALALVGVYALDIKGETNVMGWYANYILPVGALLVGLVASSGYAITSWKLGVKIRKSLLWTILGLMVIAYFAAEYVEYRIAFARFPTTPTRVTIKTAKGPQIVIVQRPGFWKTFHRSAVGWTWKKEHSGDSGEPLGAAGYFFKLLGIVGFAGGGLIIPGILGAHAYCDLCERYMHNRTLATLPASIPFQKISKKDTAALSERRKQDQAVFDEASERMKRIIAYAQGGDAAAFRAEIARDQDTAARKAATKLPRRIQISLVSCPSCASGRLESVIFSGQGKQMQQTKLPKVELSQEFVRGVSSM